jgi:hypothetical protein
MFSAHSPMKAAWFVAASPPQRRIHARLARFLYTAVFDVTFELDPASVFAPD